MRFHKYHGAGNDFLIGRDDVVAPLDREVHKLLFVPAEGFFGGVVELFGSGLP